VSNRQHTVFACVLALTCFYALRLASVEIQPWDEGLYAVRAQSIVVYGSWVDQTDHTIGGLYSSTPPPLLPWAIASSMQVFGPSIAAVRVFTVLCSGVALLLLYGVARRMMSYQSSILAICVVATCMHWTIYARQAMTEVPLMTFVLLSIWSALQAVDSTSKRNMWLYGVLAGVGFGAALLTKMTVSFFPLLVFVFLMWRRRSTILPLSLAILIGLALSAPWYVSMIVHHGSQFSNALFAPQLVGDVESTTRSLGFLYYANQLIVSHPMLIVAFIFVLIIAWKRHLVPPLSNLSAGISLVWFLASLIIFSAAPTRNPHYVVMLIPAAVLVAMYGMERILEGGAHRLVVFVYSTIIVSSMWALLPDVRTNVRSSALDPYMPLLLGVGLLLLVMPLILPKRSLVMLSVRAYRPVVYAVCGVLFLRTVSMIATTPPSAIQGGREIALHVVDSPAHSFGYLYHARNNGDVYNPQLAWYTAGWMAGWLPGKTVQSYALPAQRADENILAVASASGTSFIVYYHPGQSIEEQRRVADLLQGSYDLVPTEAEHYTLFAARTQFQ